MLSFFSRTRAGAARAFDTGKRSPGVTVAGIPWYLREQYPQVLRTMADGAEMFPDFEHWHIAAEHSVGQMEAQGYRVVKVILAPTAFAEWCRQHRLAPDRQARFRYAAEAAEARAA